MSAAAGTAQAEPDPGPGGRGPSAASVARAGRRAARSAKALSRFVSGHGAGPTVLEPLGRSGVRLIVVAGDGRWADAVVADLPTAQRICGELGLETAEWSRELSGRVTMVAGDRARMAGAGH